MPSSLRALVLPSAATVALVALAACSGSTSETPARSRAVPRSLNAIEAASEDVIDQLPAGRWVRIGDEVTKMQASWRAYRDEAQATDESLAASLAAAVADLAARVTHQDGLGTEQAANDVSRPVVELLAHYALGHPVQIGRLDVIGRQIVIDVERGDMSSAAAQVVAARREWNAVRRSVQRHHGARVVAHTDATFTQLDAAVRAADGRALTRRSRDLLELVDAMERLYRRTHA